MNIFDIDIAMYSLIDDETGEIKDYEAFEALQMERNAKIENTALWIKTLVAEGKAIREEEKALAERRRRAESRIESLKNYLACFIGREV